MEIRTISPAEADICDLEFSDLINVQDIQCMMDNFYRFAKIPMSIIDLKGKVLVSVGFQEICTRFHRIHPETFRNCLESDLKLTTGIPGGEFRLYKCRNGMWDMATPIVIGNLHIANLFMGQFFFNDESIDYDNFQSQASRYNFDEEAYFKALGKVPHLDRNDIECAKVFFLKLADSVSQLSYSNCRLAKLVEQTSLLTESLRQDITGRKKAEKELKESKAKLNIALEIGNIGVWEWNFSTDELFLDERVENIFGLEPGSFEGGYNDFENLFNEDDIPLFRKRVAKALDEDLPFEAVFRVRTLINGDKYINARALVEKDDSGGFVKMTGVFFDITEMKRGAEKVLFKLNEELLRSNKALEQFAYVASHDLQEPLRMVSCYTDKLLFKHKDLLDNNSLEYIKFITEGIERMRDMTNGLLAYSRIQTRGKELREVDMNFVVEQVKKVLSPVIQHKNAAITYETLPVFVADENEMIRLIQNLVANAIKFSKGPPEIHISSKSQLYQNTISVSDNGIGIDKENFERIFQIFQRLNPRDEYEGTGIGLAICRTIVERHGGKIWVESQPDKGSTFSFSIPCRTDKI